jgi:PAS domain S-box-containing protein
MRAAAPPPTFSSGSFPEWFTDHPADLVGILDQGVFLEGIRLRMTQFVGFGPEKWPGKCFLSFFTDEKRPEAELLLNEMTRFGGWHTLETVFQGPEGNPARVGLHLSGDPVHHKVIVMAWELPGTIPGPARPSWERQFEALVGSMEDLVFTLDLSQRHTGIYGKQFQRLGLSPDFFLGKTPAEVLGKDAAEIHEEANRKALEGQFVTYQWHTGHGNQELFYQTTVAPVFDHFGAVQGLIGIGQDITPLIRREQDYHRLFHASPVPQWIYDMDTFEFLQVNEAAIRHYGYSEQEFLSMTIKDIRPKTEIPRLIQVHEAFRTYEGIGHYGLFSHLKKDGSAIQVQISGHRLVFEGRDCELIIAYDITQLQEILHRLESANARYALVNQATNDVIFDWDVASGKVFWGGSFDRLLGYTLDNQQTTATRWLEWIPSSHRETVAEGLANFRQSSGTQVCTFEFPVISRRFGKNLFLRMRAYALRDEAGQATRLIGALEDVTLERKTRKKLEASYRTLRDYKNALDQSTNVVFTDTSGVIMEVNESTCQLSGYRRDELIGQHTRIHKSGFHPASFYKDLWDTITQGREWRGEIKNRRKDGSFYWVDTTIVALRDKNGQPYQYLAIRVDITHKKDAEQELKRMLTELKGANERFVKVAQATRDAIWDWDIERNFLYWGDGMKQLFGHDPIEAISPFTSWLSRIHPDDNGRVKHILDATLKDQHQSLFHCEYRFRKASGEYTLVSDRGLVIRNEFGKAIRMVGAITDITQERAYLQAIEAHNRQLQEIAWLQSHALRGPLSRMMGLIQMLNTDDTLTEQEKPTFMGYLQSSAIELDEVVRAIVEKSESLSYQKGPNRDSE